MTRSAFIGLLEEILAAPPGSLKKSDTRDSVENWSSLADVEILTVIASELDIEAEPLEYESIGDLLAALEEQQAFVPG